MGARRAVKLRIQKIHDQAADRPEGYVEDVISRGIVEGEWLEISSEELALLRDKYRPKAPPVPVAPPTLPAPPQHGPGRELKKMISALGIKPAPNCQCNARAAEMDARGPAWCRENLDLIVEWLREEADRAGLPFVAPAARLLVRRAIRKAEKKAAALPETLTETVGAGEPLWEGASSQT